jgi:hypothetical protein
MRITLAVIILLCSLLPLSAATITWHGDGDWTDASRWSTGAAPRAGDDVVIAGGNVRLAMPTPALRSLTVSGTLTVTSPGASVTARRLTVAKGGILMAAGPVTGADQLCRLTLTCADALTVAAGGRIDVDGKGYAGGIGHAQNDDPTSAGYGPGAGGYPKVWGASPGGSHGGRGGTPVAKPAYDALDAPRDAGSGGGGGNKVGGGAGGGAVRIEAGAVRVDGVITANGTDGVGWSYGGGGAGGSIFITAAAIGGTGQVSADGGRGSIYAGGGGGGRVAVSYRQVGARGVVFSATGGPNGGGGPGLEQPKHFGEPGTLCFPNGRVPGRVIPHTGRVLAPGGSDTADARETAYYWMPWKVNTPMITVTKELYLAHPRPNAGALAGRTYVGPGLEMLERQGVEARDDVHTERRMRFSADNGRTWSDFVPQPDTVRMVSGVEVGEYEGPHFYDDHAGVLVQTWLRQIQVGNIWGNGICNCFTYWRLSRDGGRTWSEPKQFRYEPGAAFDPAQPLKPDFLLHNQGYIGSNIIRHRNGTLITALALANAPDDPQNDTRTWKRGSLCMVGRWDATAQDYVWTAGQRISVSETVSSRGMDEPEVAELQDGRVLVIWRISNTAVTPGRKWFSVSRDGGLTLGPLQELKYDDGSGFYSPGSYHRTIRHSITGKLYWIGNICSHPPTGNSPRYPLVIAEVDERIPALKKHTVSVIDDRDEFKQGFGVQFSNFSLIENRETHNLELFLTTYGQQADQDNWMTADCYRYTVTVK